MSSKQITEKLESITQLVKSTLEDLELLSAFSSTDVEAFLKNYEGFCYDAYKVAQEAADHLLNLENDRLHRAGQF